MSDRVDICAEIKNETDAAYLMCDGDNETWIPKSQLNDLEPLAGNCVSEGEFVQFSLPVWLAKKKGLI